MEKKDEIKRIREAYERRKESIPARRYSFFNTANLFMLQDRDRQTIEILKRCGITSLEGKKILDVGCGDGGELRNLMRYGARPENLSGIDLLPERVESALAISPNIDFRCGSVEVLPYADGSFDIVMQFTVFTSILSERMKKTIAGEMLRVLKPDGIILWYDYHMNNPRNPDVRGVRRKEIHELFPQCGISLKRVTLAPPLARALVPCSMLLCRILEKFPLLCTHYLGVIRKRG